MADARDIKKSESEIPHHVSRTLGTMSFSLSPAMSFHSSPSSFGASNFARAAASAAAKHLKPFATEDIKILLLENVNQTGRDILTEQGYQVEALTTSLSEDELISKIRSVTQLLFGSETLLIPFL
jgi:D-3-phosphoglycerate dehydrogenase / 2-oxoglutarate reductase